MSVQFDLGLAALLTLLLYVSISSDEISRSISSWANFDRLAAILVNTFKKPAVSSFPSDSNAFGDKGTDTSIS